MTNVSVEDFCNKQYSHLGHSTFYSLLVQVKNAFFIRLKLQLQTEVGAKCFIRYS